MGINTLVRGTFLFITTAILTYVLLLIFGSYTANILYLLGILGLTAFVLIDQQSFINVSFIIKYIAAIITNIVYRTHEINNYIVDNRELEFYFQGVLVKTSPTENVFRFISFNDLFLIVIFTTFLILVYLGMKYVFEKIIQSNQLSK